MGYRLSYPSFGEEKRRIKQKSPLAAWGAALLVVVLVLGALAVKGRGLPWVQKYLLPGDPAVTAAALDGLLEDLREGSRLSDAITAFCREITEHAVSP